MIIMAVDPGASGGIAILSGVIVSAFPTPDTDEKIVELLRCQCEPLQPAICIFEKVGGYIGDKQPGSAMFNFGDSNGFVRGVIKGMGIPVEMVTPQNWQKVIGIPKRSKEETKANWKDRLVAKAQSLYPQTFTGLNKTQSRAIADAVLMLEYGRRLRNF